MKIKIIAIITLLLVSVIGYSQLNYTQKMDFNQTSILKMDVGNDLPESVVMVKNKPEIKMILTSNRLNSVKIGATVLFITGVALITSSFIKNDEVENSTKVAYVAMMGLFTVSYIYILTLE
jgi:hypothetical protein